MRGAADTVISRSISLFGVSTRKFLLDRIQVVIRPCPSEKKGDVDGDSAELVRIFFRACPLRFSPLVGTSKLWATHRQGQRKNEKEKMQPQLLQRSRCFPIPNIRT